MFRISKGMGFAGLFDLHAFVIDYRATPFFLFVISFSFIVYFSFSRFHILLISMPQFSGLSNRIISAPEMSHSRGTFSLEN